MQIIGGEIWFQPHRKVRSCICVTNHLNNTIASSENRQVTKASNIHHFYHLSFTQSRQSKTIVRAYELIAILNWSSKIFCYCQIIAIIIASYLRLPLVISVISNSFFEELKNNVSKMSSLHEKYWDFIIICFVLATIHLLSYHSVQLFDLDYFIIQ